MNKQEKIKQFVEDEVIGCKTSMVDFILRVTEEHYSEYYQNAPFTGCDIENYFIDNTEKIEKIKEQLRELPEDIDQTQKEELEKFWELQDELNKLEEEDGSSKDVFEWWEVSSFLMEKLKEKNEVVIPHMNIWGRCTTGQAIYLDDIIQKIAEENFI